MNITGLKRVVGGVFLIALSSLSRAAIAEEVRDVCIRNYIEPATKYDPCAEDIKGYVYTINADDETEALCALKSADSLCASAAGSYSYVRSKAGLKICVANFDQPGIANFCRQNPGLYKYVRGVPEE